MGCFNTKPKQEGILRILVLGISGSGKSTFTKQLRIIHTDGFGEVEKRQFVNILKMNIVHGIKELCEQTKILDLTPDPRNRKNIRYFREREIINVDLEDEDVVKKIVDLWKDNAVQEACELCKNYQIQVSQLPYLMHEDNFYRILSTDFVPTNEDILHGRQRTAGSNTTRFSHMDFAWEIIDIGGQAPERVKWDSVFQANVNAVIYFAGLDEYNMNSSEESSKTKMQISFECFKQVMYDALNIGCCRILFLNKFDLFKVKIVSKRGYKEFVEVFPDYVDYLESNFEKSQDYHFLDDDERVIQSSVKFIEKKFLDLLENDPDIDDIIVRPTTAVDTKQMETIFEGVRDSIFHDRLKKSMM